MPGSDKDFPFYRKSIALEVEDALAVVEYLQQHHLNPQGVVHVIGLSTGAIVASLLRGRLPPHTGTITAIAGLDNLKEGLRFDFDVKQMRDFQDIGYCTKQFWLPPGYLENDGTSEVVRSDYLGQSCPDGWFLVLVSLDLILILVIIIKSPFLFFLSASQTTHIMDVNAAQDNEKEDGVWVACDLRLGAQYINEVLAPPCDQVAYTLDIRTAVATSPAPPFLVIHGEADNHVPLACGRALFEASAAPHQFTSIKKGNHFLSSSNHLKKACNAILDFISSQA